MDVQKQARIDLDKLGEVGAVKSATRVLDLFEFLGRWEAERTHTEIAEELRIPKSSLTQLLKTLVGRGYLNYVPASKGYVLGPAIAALASHSNEGRDFIFIASTVLPRLVSETQETSALNVLKGDKSEVVAAVVGSHRLQFTMNVGDVAPLYATSGGKALLAHLPEAILREYLDKVSFEAVTPNTITSRTRLEHELEAARSTGVAFVFEEFTPGVVGIAKPILDSAGFPLASINVAMPVTRYNSDKRDQCTEALARAARYVQERSRI